MKMIKTVFCALTLSTLLLTLPGPVGATEGDVLATGEFEGRSDHEVNGTASIVQTGDATLIVLGSDFELDGAPDPKLGFGSDGKYDEKSKVAHLGELNGAQIYKVPASVDVSSYNEFYVWCEKFSVPLGVAKLK